MWHGTMSQLDSLLHGGAILPYGSLIMPPGTIFSNDSLSSSGAVHTFGSIFVEGSISYFVSLAPNGAIREYDSMLSEWY